MSTAAGEHAGESADPRRTGRIGRVYRVSERVGAGLARYTGKCYDRSYSSWVYFLCKAIALQLCFSRLPPLGLLIALKRPRPGVQVWTMVCCCVWVGGFLLRLLSSCLCTSTWAVVLWRSVAWPSLILEAPLLSTDRLHHEGVL